jgi:hypothetical protein
MTDEELLHEKAGARNRSGPSKLDHRPAPPVILHQIDNPARSARTGSAAGYGMGIASDQGRLVAITERRDPVFKGR